MFRYLQMTWSSSLHQHPERLYEEIRRRFRCFEKPIFTLESSYEIITLRGNWALSSRKVFFLIANSATVGCTVPFTSVARETKVCSPGVAPSQMYLNSFQ